GTVGLASANLKLTGEATGDNAGYSLAGAGDVNDDGIDDLAIGAPNDDDGETDAGAVYVLYGPLSSGTVGLASADLKLTGEATGDATGRSIAGAGDVNDDGVDDLAVGVVGDEDGGNNAGAVYILYGPLSSGTVGLASADLKLTGEATGDQAGTSLAGARDVNDDGIDDLVIGARYEATAYYDSGAVYVLLGPLTTGEVSLSTASLKLTGEGSGHYLGHAVVLADVNDDGLEDIILGTVQQDTYILLGLGY
ncbi:MAG: integrin alpha, partial [Candidatus Uhrbacteria bacterium]|nr:integrin alpha [Candidatus Uhrbacteria bacterium]